jgi:Na+-translocating ferredoxin:NAD+ oxidoreductase RNF subunit RnfB
MAVNTKDRIKRIYEALPKTDCGRCGFESCAKFARAVAEGKASPFGCRRDPGVGYAISGILRGSMSAGYASSREVLGQDIRRLSREVDDILARIERLETGETVERASG